MPESKPLMKDCRVNISHQGSTKTKEEIKEQQEKVKHLHKLVIKRKWEEFKEKANKKDNEIDTIGYWGNTVLHLLIMNWNIDFNNGKEDQDHEYQQCIDLMIDNNVDVNALNVKNQTALYLAAEGIIDFRNPIKGKENLKAVTYLMEKAKKCIILDFGEAKIPTNITLKDRWYEIFRVPRFEPNEINMKAPSANYLFHLMEINEERFVETFRGAEDYIIKSTDFLRAPDNVPFGITALQRACYVGLKLATQTMIDAGADITEKTDRWKKSPVEIACQQGNVEILKILIDNHNNSKTPFDAIAKVYPADTDSERLTGQLDCLKYIEGKFDNIDAIRQKDVNNRTPLDYAMLHGFKQAMLSIMKKGRYIMLTDENRAVPEDVFQQFLDEQIIIEAFDYTYEDREEKITLQHDFLKPIDENKETQKCRETEVLKKISSNKNLKQFLMHPVLETFIEQKWKKAKKWFWVNLIMHIIFTLLITGYTGFMEVLPISAVDSFNIVFRWSLWVLLTSIICRELVQFFLLRGLYFRSLDNWLEVPMLALTLWTTLNNCGVDENLVNTKKETCAQIGAGAVLLAWIELLLILGRHPKFAVQVAMLLRVSKSFVSYGCPYLLLLMAFAFSFRILFKNKEGTPFPSVFISFFKTFVMFSGEYDSSNIPFSYEVILSYVIFVVFILIVSTIVINLLNGLAVSDIKEIIENARVYSLVTSVEYVTLIDQYLYILDKCCILPKCCSNNVFPKDKKWQLTIRTSSDFAEPGDIIKERLFNKLQTYIASNNLEKHIIKAMNSEGWKDENDPKR